jgi:hypothetical protein
VSLEERYGSPELRQAAITDPRASKANGERLGNLTKAIGALDQRLVAHAEVEGQDLQGQRAEPEMALEQARTVQTSYD